MKCCLPNIGFLSRLIKLKACQTNVANRRRYWNNNGLKNKSWEEFEKLRTVMFTSDYIVTTRNITSKCLMFNVYTIKYRNITLSDPGCLTLSNQYALKTWRYEIVSIYEELMFGFNHLGLQTMSWNTSTPARLASPINIDLGFADNVCVSSVLRSCPKTPVLGSRLSRQRGRLSPKKQSAGYFRQFASEPPLACTEPNTL